MRWAVQELRDRAGALDMLADDVDAQADDVVDRTEVQWVSDRAQEFRQDLLHLGSDTRDEATRLREAATAFRQHADDVEQTLDAIDRARESFFGALRSARDTIAGGLEAVGDAAYNAAESVVDRAGRVPDDYSPDWLRW